LHSYKVKSYDGNTTSTGISGSITAQIYPFYALVEKKDDKSVEPLGIVFGTDKNNVNFAFSNNVEQVGSIGIPTYKSITGVLRFETKYYMELLEVCDSKFYLKTKERILEITLNEMSEVQNRAYIRDGAVHKWIALSWVGNVI
jgi:hypothetical protein